jgi:outer membrane receptor protein involved in Fe transport
MLRPYFVLPVLFVFVNVLNIQGQTNIMGSVNDPADKPLQNANILLLSPLDSALIAGAVSEEDGKFLFLNISAGTYLLTISAVGFSTFFELLEVGLNSELSLPPIPLHEKSDELDEVVVSAQKPLFEKQMDRTIINVQQSITSAGSSVLQVLQKSPGVTINQQNNTIMLNGKTGVSLMINDRISKLPVEALLQMLDGLNAANVERIELIHNPPAKYDAEGTAGIIHIVIQQSADLGTNGNLGFFVGKRGKETLGINFNLHNRAPKISYFVDYSLSYDHSVNTFENDLKIIRHSFVSHFNSINERSPQTTVHNFRLGSEMEMGPKTSIGTLITFYQRHFTMDALTKVVDTINPDSSRIAEMEVEELNRWQGFTTNLNLTHLVNDKNSVRFDIDYLWFHNKNPSNYSNALFYPESNLQASELIDIQKNTPIHVGVAKADYTYRPSSTFVGEAGIKGTLSNFVNEIDVMYQEGNIWRTNADLSLTADLDEKIAAVYVSADWYLDEVNQVRGGMRYEYTSTYIRTTLQKGLVDRSFGNFFPSLFYKRILNDQWTVSIGYSKRITRPTFNDMAPFVYMADPNTYYSGNPELKPALTDGLSLDLKIRRSVVSLGFSNSRNQIANFQPEVGLLTNKQVVRSQNLEYEKLYSINLSIPWIFSNSWDVQFNAGGFNRTIKTTHLEENAEKNYRSLSLTMANTIALPKDFSLEVVGSYDSKLVWGLLEFKPLGSLNIGLQKKLKGNKGVLKLVAEDILRTNIWRMYSHPTQQIDTYLLLDFHNQSIRLSFSRSFGNRKLAAVEIKSGAAEERNRVQ